MPKAPESVNADIMSQDELRRKLQTGLDDAESGNVRPAAKAFDEFREKHTTDVLDGTSDIETKF